MTPPYLTQVELAVRWRISPRTLDHGDGRQGTAIP